MNWRAELQQQIDINNAMRELSDKRIGDQKTEYSPSTEGAGRPRRIKSQIFDDTKILYGVA